MCEPCNVDSFNVLIVLVYFMYLFSIGYLVTFWDGAKIVSERMWVGAKKAYERILCTCTGALF